MVGQKELGTIVELGPHDKLFEASSHVCDQFKIRFSVIALKTSSCKDLSAYSHILTNI